MFNTYIKQVEINSGGGIRVTILKQAFSDDDRLISEQPHQMTIGPFDDVNHIVEANNNHLQAMGFPSMNAEELAVVLKLRDHAHAQPLIAKRIVIEKKLLDERLAKEAEEHAKRETGAAKAAEQAEKEQDAEFDRRVAAAVAKLSSKNK